MHALDEITTSEFEFLLRASCAQGRPVSLHTARTLAEAGKIAPQDDLLDEFDQSEASDTSE